MNSYNILCLLLVAVSSAAFAAEKSPTKENGKQPAEHHRGWIGGEFKLARRHWSWSSTAEEVIAFPKSLTNAQKAGILITALSTNTPAYLAGLREADLILELDGEKMTSLSHFRRKIDQAKLGDSFMVHAYREGELLDYSVTVGRETFTENGAFGLALFFDLPVPSLKFNPSFSLIALGLSQESDQRTELASAEQVYRRASAKEHRPTDVCWRAWVGPLFAMHTRQIHSQELSPGESSK